MNKIETIRKLQQIKSKTEALINAISELNDISDNEINKHIRDITHSLIDTGTGEVK